MREFLPYGQHWLTEKEADAASDVILHKWVTQGEKVDEFEAVLAKRTGAKYAVAVSSGTAALELAVKVAGISNGDEVITTPHTFVADANAALFNNAVPVFADVRRKTANIDPGKIKEKITDKTKALLPVHFAGQPCEMSEINEIAEENSLAVIEDATHALGAEYKDKKIGSQNICCFSFHPVKAITTGEGGAVTTDNEELYEKLKMLRNHGIDRSVRDRAKTASYVYDVNYLSRNFRLTDIQCAIGIEQLNRLDEFLSLRNKFAEQYRKELEGVDGIILPELKANVKHAWHLFTVFIDSVDRDKVFDFMRSKNIGVNVHYIPVYRLSLYREKFGPLEKQFPNEEWVFKRILTLPLFPKMKPEDVTYSVESLKEALRSV